MYNPDYNHEYNAHRHKQYQPPHQPPQHQLPHHPSRHDVFMISNPMMFRPPHADHMGNMGNKHQRAQAQSVHSATMQLNESYADANSTERSMEHHNHKDAQRNVCGRFRLKFVVNFVILFIATAIISGVEFGWLPHKHQSYRCKDPKLSYKYTGDTIRPSVLGVVCVLLPLATFFLVEFLRLGSDWRRITSLVWRWTRLIIIGNIVINLFLTEVLKTVFGEPRPHFLDTCAPNATDCVAGDVVENYRCTNSIDSFMMVRDASRSFPSGHASLSVFTSVYCAAYIYYRLKSLSIDCGALLKPFLMACVMLWGFSCGLSRITDHRHHWWDVLAGSILGGATALFTVYGLARKFHFEEKHRPSSSCTKLCDDNKGDITV